MENIDPNIRMLMKIGFWEASQGIQALFQHYY